MQVRVFGKPTEPVLVLQRRGSSAVPVGVPTTAMRQLQLQLDGAGGDDGEAFNLVHPGRGGADHPGRAADQVPGHQRRGHLLVRAAVGVGLVGGDGDITGCYTIDEEGVLQSVDLSVKFVNAKPARIEAKVRHAHAPGVGQVHALHGALLPGQRPPVRQEVGIFYHHHLPPQGNNGFHFLLYLRFPDIHFDLG
jgi:hypothetical protein